ncbi:hypothetical protein I4U23_004701 [Adineta vaga]|nr:hypothetical protein I4U23_004701 [Adineta vaga]
MFYQAYQQLRTDAHNLFRQSNDQLWLAHYLDMHSTDQGGPYDGACSPRLPLKIIYEHLNYAISSCSIIDGDGTMDDAPNAEDFSTDDNSNK